MVEYEIVSLFQLFSWFCIFYDFSRTFRQNPPLYSIYNIYNNITCILLLFSEIVVKKKKKNPRNNNNTSSRIVSRFTNTLWNISLVILYYRMVKMSFFFFFISIIPIEILNIVIEINTAEPYGCIIVIRIQRVPKVPEILSIRESGKEFCSISIFGYW